MSLSQDYRAFRKFISEATWLPVTPVRFPITIHKKVVAFGYCGNKVTKFEHTREGTFNSWESAQDAIEDANARKPLSLVSGEYTSHYLIDAGGRRLESRRDGWKLNDDGVPVAKCSSCGSVGTADSTCCNTELPF